MTSRAIGLVLLANLLFSFVDTSTKWLLGVGLVAVQLAFMRYAVHFAITAAEWGLRRQAFRPPPAKTGGLILLRSFCLVSATIANFIALGHLPLAVTSALLYLSPIFICLFARAILGEVIRPHHWASIVLGLTGALLIVWPFGQAINWYAVLMLYPAAGMALYQVLTRKLAPEVPPSTLQLATGVLGTLALAPFALFAWTSPDQPLAWLLLFAIGAFAWAGHEALTRAHAHAPASDLAPFGYSFILFLTLAGFIVWQDIPTPLEGAGIALVIIAGLYSWRAQHRAQVSLI